MARITELTLRDVRCFRGPQTARLGRITLLVGDNSTGKSTFLGCYNVFSTLTAMSELEDRNHFDAPPFRMGAFDTIARSGASDFGVAGRFEDHCHTGARFDFERGSRGLPAERRVELEYADAEGRCPNLAITRVPDAAGAWEFRGPGFEFRVGRSEVSYSGMSTWLSRAARHGHLPFGGEPARFRKRSGATPTLAEQAQFARFASFFRSVLPLPGRRPFTVSAIDPELPRRRREYPAAPSFIDPQDVDFMACLRTVGAALGLWTDIAVESGGAGQGVQVVVDRNGQRHNLTDVGYGVHSLLSLVRDLSEHHAQPDAILLLQQPEVHVHPSAQAAFAELLAKSACAFVIETHSQHLVDRLRISCMKGVLAPEELSIVYFEPHGDDAVRVHSIGVDAQANLVDAPPGYGSFFVTETVKLLGLDE